MTAKQTLDRCVAVLAAAAAPAVAALIDAHVITAAVGVDVGAAVAAAVAAWHGGSAAQARAGAYRVTDPPD